ncbi:MAG: sigma-70 family RNA polymerase sigma factor [Phycisphaerales bacterium]
MRIDEAILSQRAASGDAEAFTALAAAAVPAMRRWVGEAIPARWRALVGEDDVIQQACADALLAIGTFTHRGEGSFGAWLGTLARHNLLNTIRMLEADKRGGRARRVTSPDESRDALIDTIAPDLSTPSRAVARSEARAALEAAIAGLPQPYRRVVEAYDLSGLDIASVARELGRSVGATFMLRARAHRVLAAAMGSGGAYLSGS